MKTLSLLHAASSLAAAGLLSFVSAPSASADSVATDPVGFITGTANGGGSFASPKLTPVAPTLVQPVAWQGLAATITATTITSGTAATGWTVDQFNGANGAHFVEIVTGANAGAWTDIVTTGSNTLTVADDLTSFSTGNVSIRIRKHMTISDFLGATNTAGLLAGASIGTADEVLIYDGGVPTFYWYHDGSQGPAGWYDASYNPSGNVVIAPNQGVMIKRKTAAAVSFKVTGSVKTGATLIPVVQNLNVLPVSSAASLTLDSSQLYTGNPVTGFKAGATIGDSDEITLFTTTSQAFYWYHDGSQGPAGWYDAFYNPSGAVQLAPGSSFLLRRKPPGSPFNWKVPAPSL